VALAKAGGSKVKTTRRLTVLAIGIREDKEIMRATSSDFVVARDLGGTAAAGAEVLRGARPARGRAFLGKKGALVVVAVALLAFLAAFATLIPASEAPSADHNYSAGSTHDQPRAAPQMSEKEALDAYGKLPLSFIPKEGQATDKAVRYYAQGAGYGFFFTHEEARLSFADGEGRGHALDLSFLEADPHATLEAQKRLSGEVNYLGGMTRPSGARGCPPTQSSSTAGCGLG
jgi:hypothetical protein